MNASTPHINRALALGRITLKLRYRPKDASYKPGATIKGVREIWIDGEHWLTATISYHGCHGASHTLEYAGGGALMECPNPKRPEYRRPVKISSRSHRQRHTAAARGETVPDQFDAIKIKVLELLEAGKLESPAFRKKQREASAAEYRAEREAEQAHRAAMLQGIFSLRDRGDLTSAEREGLAWLYKEALADDMPAAEGATDGE